MSLLVEKVVPVVEEPAPRPLEDYVQNNELLPKQRENVLEAVLSIRAADQKKQLTTQGRRALEDGLTKMTDCVLKIRDDTGIRKFSLKFGNERKCELDPNNPDKGVSSYLWVDVVEEDMFSTIVEAKRSLYQWLPIGETLREMWTDDLPITRQGMWIEPYYLAKMLSLSDGVETEEVWGSRQARAWANYTALKGGLGCFEGHSIQANTRFIADLYRGDAARTRIHLNALGWIPRLRCICMALGLAILGSALRFVQQRSQRTLLSSLVLLILILNYSLDLVHLTFLFEAPLRVLFLFMSLGWHFLALIPSLLWTLLSVPVTGLGVSYRILTSAYMRHSRYIVLTLLCDSLVLLMLTLMLKRTWRQKLIRLLSVCGSGEHICALIVEYADLSRVSSRRSGTRSLSLTESSMDQMISTRLSLDPCGLPSSVSSMAFPAS